MFFVKSFYTLTLMAKKTVGIIGYPLSHSVSPAMHNAAFKHLGLDWEYLPFEVKPEDLEKKISGLKEKGLVGFNVTIPHKETILPMLNFVNKLPKIIGAVNTVRIDEDRLIGFNTDGAGFIESLRIDAGVDPKGKGAVLLGAGGAARAVAVMLAEEKAASITLTDIDTKKGEALAAYIGSLFKSAVNFIPPKGSGLKEAIAKADILINATPIGMHPKEDKCPIDENTELRAQSTVFDLIYNPPETKLMKLAKKQGLKAVNGLGMLVRQGALSFTIWTGREPPIDVMFKAAKEALGLG